MTGIFVSRAPAGKPRCARCHRPFTPKSSDQKYGPTCARKVAEQMQHDGKLFLGPDVMIKNEGGNLCRGCGTDLSDEPGRQLCDECLDMPIQLDNCDPDNLFARQHRKRQSPEESAVDAYLRAVIL